MPSVTLLQIGLPNNYHHLLQKIWHVSLPFITTTPGTDSLGPGNITLLDRPDPVFVDRFNSGYYSSRHRRHLLLLDSLKVYRHFTASQKGRLHQLS